MLTVKENMRQVIPGGNPDRLVNQYEAIQLLFHPFMLTSPLLKKGDENVVNAWGVTNSFPDNGPGLTVKKPRWTPSGAVPVPSIISPALPREAQRPAMAVMF